MKHKYDWPALELEYVKCLLDANEFARQHNVNLDTLRKYITKNGWNLKREVFHKHVSLMMQRDASDAIVEQRKERGHKLENMLFEAIASALAKCLVSSDKLLQANATAAGILMDKYHRQIGHEVNVSPTDTKVSGDIETDDEEVIRFKLERFRKQRD